LAIAVFAMIGALTAFAACAMVAADDAVRSRYWLVRESPAYWARVIASLGKSAL
jgi:hypothetical protein